MIKLDIFIDDVLMQHIKNYNHYVENFNEVYKKIKEGTIIKNNYLIHLSGSIEIEAKEIINILNNKINESLE